MYHGARLLFLFYEPVLLVRVWNMDIKYYNYPSIQSENGSCFMTAVMIIINYNNKDDDDDDDD